MADGGPFGEMVLGERHAHLTNSLLQTRCQKSETEAPRGWCGGEWSDYYCLCNAGTLENDNLNLGNLGQLKIWIFTLSVFLFKNPSTFFPVL